jgi:hypothetical protein
MNHPAHDHCVLLVSCALCERLHEPLSDLDSNPICPRCAEKLAEARLAGLDHHPTPDGDSP